MEYILFTLFLVIFIAYLVLRYMNRAMSNAQQELDNAMKILSEYVHMVEIEEIDGVQYWYDATDREFLGQGADTDAVIAVLQTRFPKHVFVLPSLEVVSAPSWKPQAASKLTVG